MNVVFISKKEKPGDNSFLRILEVQGTRLDHSDPFFLLAS